MAKATDYQKLEYLSNLQQMGLLQSSTMIRPRVSVPSTESKEPQQDFQPDPCYLLTLEERHGLLKQYRSI